MTHILSEITIRNFKSLIHETLELSAFTPLVGYNNAGKSNILEAIRWVLKGGSLTDTAFYDITVAIEMTGKISGITATILGQLPANQQAAIQPFLSTDALHIKRTQGQPNAGARGISLLVRDPANIGNS